MQSLTAFQMIHEHREDLICEAAKQRLVQEVRVAHPKKRVLLSEQVRSALRMLRISISSFTMQAR